MRAHFIVSPLLWALPAAGCLFSCNKVYEGEQLSPKTSQRLQRLGLLNPGEKIYQFYSNAPNKAAGAGNFYTSERIAQYWLDDDKQKTQLSFAYYKDITRIDTTYLDKTLTYISYMVITRKDGSQFQVYVGGNKLVVSAFFEHSIAHWKAATCSSN
ncbi:hypothetical protein [Hymenobacter baengnokdamensis]|uniref:hypothetical protein n=1 Tax=Hymenobacter baengnokdamensis TaxID=2615203 RepID=UPI001248A594|nr:hypothetical protein [Hymenobacter baengnokdamensis]